MSLYEYYRRAMNDDNCLLGGTLTVCLTGAEAEAHRAAARLIEGERWEADKGTVYEIPQHLRVTYILSRKDGLSHEQAWAKALRTDKPRPWWRRVFQTNRLDRT